MRPAGGPVPGPQPGAVEVVVEFVTPQTNDAPNLKGRHVSDVDEPVERPQRDAEVLGRVGRAHPLPTIRSHEIWNSTKRGDRSLARRPFSIAELGRHADRRRMGLIAGWRTRASKRGDTPIAPSGRRGRAGGQHEQRLSALETAD